MISARTVLAVCAALSFAAPAQAQDSGAAASGKDKSSDKDNYVVRDGDTLWDLSGTYMGSKYEWPRLWSYNPEITNPHWIYPGHLLRLHEGAEGGYSLAGPGQGGEGGPPTAARFGSGFGAMFNKNARWNGAGVVVGEEVYLDRDALDQAAVIVGSPEEQMLLSPSDQVYLQFKKGAEPTQGKELTVFIRLHRQEVKPSAGKVRVYKPNQVGEVVRVLGSLRIESYDRDKRIARASILDARDPIERGFEVTDMPSRLAQVAPKTNAKKIESHVIASNRPLGMFAQGQIVFIDAGSEKGVQVGNRFLVIRRGDDWRKHLTLREDLSGAERPDPTPLKDENYPEEAVAEAIVLYVRSQSCTALINASVTQVEPGDKVEMREGY
jgi:hypothetical protein